LKIYKLTKIWITVVSKTTEKKVNLLGNANVGKTTLFNFELLKVFKSVYQPTIGATYVPINFTIDSKQIILNV
jgi:GTPase SAR1 family protein